MSQKTRVFMYTSGLCYASCCAPAEMAGDDVLADAREHHASGTEQNWSLSSDKTFRGGQPNPCRCDQEADRQHWLLEC